MVNLHFYEVGKPHVREDLGALYTICLFFTAMIIFEPFGWPIFQRRYPLHCYQRFGLSGHE